MAIGAAVGISRSIVRPLRGVVGVANAVSRGHLDGRISCDDGSEIGDQAITRMDEGTQQNAALVEQAFAAAQSMEHQAGELVGLAAAFKSRG